MSAEKIKCWCCERIQSAGQFKPVPINFDVEMGRNGGKIRLLLSSPDNLREEDEMRLCETCKGHIVAEIQDAIALE